MAQNIKSSEISKAIEERLTTAMELIKSAAIDVHKIIVEEDVHVRDKYQWGSEEASRISHNIIEMLCRVQDNVEGKDLHDTHGKYKQTVTYRVRRALGYKYP